MDWSHLSFIRLFLICAFVCHGLFSSFAQDVVRQDILLGNGWKTVADDDDIKAYEGFEKVNFNVRDWKEVEVPHNWDQYEGYRRMKHGNRHGYAWYRKTFTVEPNAQQNRYFLWFEGVGSYATVWLNGKQVGKHAGGRTSFTLDVTDAVYLNGKENLLAVRADHPAFIRDLPWVCGGCSDEIGFSEGSQPMGIFRPVHLIVTNEVRIEPFGVHIWNDTTVTEKSAELYIETEIKNYGTKSRSITLVSRLMDNKGVVVAETQQKKKILPGTTEILHQKTPQISNPILWSLEDPYLYTLVSEVVEKREVVDRTSTPYGIRWISWEVGMDPGVSRFLLNGKPVFINGTAEYEHLMGRSHAFTAEQVKARVMQMKAAGFNAFRDAHQPHNLRYQQYWDSLGFLWWTQLAAHIWFDTPEFRANFKSLLKDWVKERRNSPSIILWGLENESTLPEDFARECTDLIRELDPTTSSQRKVTTCNGGSGTDWDVPQNWTGTYGGDPQTYAEDIQRQMLIGEYGAWRSIDLHTEGPFMQKGPYSEERICQLMETKIRLAESVKDRVCGHFQWIFSSHENPGRVQGGEGLRELDRVGPVNYKGLLTSWGEPLDVFYMYRSNYAPKETEPMVYIVSHSWPDRWLETGKKDSISVYSNCDEVELFNDVKKLSLGKKTNKGKGTHFQWDGVDIKYNVLYAVGYVDGREVAHDYIVLNHLPQAPHFHELIEDEKITAPDPDLHYLYRVNCGGPDYEDGNGNRWMADVHKSDKKTWGSLSWTDDFPGTPSFYASQRRTHDPIKGTADWSLFQSYRYGQDKLRFDFPVQDGDYLVELYFAEPWYGTGGGLDCQGWRLFDVAINGEIVIDDLDIWKEAGHDHALKKTVKVSVTGGELSVSFPHVASGQAVISAIAIATTDRTAAAAPRSPTLIENLVVSDKNASGKWAVQYWMDTGQRQYTDDSITFSALPPRFYGAEWIRTSKINGFSDDPYMAKFNVTEEADVYIAMDAAVNELPEWLSDYEDAKLILENDYSGEHQFKIYRKRFPKGSTVELRNNGRISTREAKMYTVTVIASTTMVPAVDLRPSAQYKAEDAVLKGAGITRNTLYGKECISFKNTPEGIVEWNIMIGVADFYALGFKYANTTGKNLLAEMQILAADGTVMKEELLEFKPTPEKKWRTLHSSTGTSINAGRYTVRVTSKAAHDLNLSGLTVQ